MTTIKFKLPKNKYNKDDNKYGLISNIDEELLNSHKCVF